MFQEVDLVVMPSRTEGFGLAGLEALSAGLPVLVSHNSGFGEALSSVPFGSSIVVSSEDPTDWTAAITKIWAKDRKGRLEEVEMLRDSYDKKYNWAKQIKDLLHKLISWTHGMNVNFISNFSAKNFGHACWPAPFASNFCLLQARSVTGNLRGSTFRLISKYKNVCFVLFLCR